MTRIDPALVEAAVAAHPWLTLIAFAFWFGLGYWLGRGDGGLQRDRD